MGWLSTPSRIRQFSGTRLLFLLIAIAAFGVTEWGRHVYRPWIYARGINDFGLADSVGNLGGIVVQVFVTVGLLNATKQQSLRLAALLSIGYVAYEFLQPYLPKGVFDWKDVIATALGYCVSTAILWTVWKIVDRRSTSTSMPSVVRTAARQGDQQHRKETQ